MAVIIHPGPNPEADLAVSQKAPGVHWFMKMEWIDGQLYMTYIVPHMTF